MANQHVTTYVDESIKIAPRITSALSNVDASASARASGKRPNSSNMRKRGKEGAAGGCLDFILSIPAEPILVGYGTGYDATQILRGISNVSEWRNRPKRYSRGRFSPGAGSEFDVASAEPMR
jgi:hypothetical protein